MRKKSAFVLTAVFLFAQLTPLAIYAQIRRATPPPPVTRTNGEPGSPVNRNAAGQLQNPSPGNVEEGVAEALTLIQDNYIDGDKLDYNETFKAAIGGMLRSLDPHSNYFDREEFEELRTDQRSEYFGIGASIQNETVAGKTDTYIIATFEGSPAQRAGLRFGDKITSVDGTDMRGKSSLDVRNKIRGPRGTTVKVTVERASSQKEEVVEIVRDAVSQPSIPDAYMLKPGVGYIGMTQGFNFTTSDELQQAMEKLRGEGMTSLVLDLRGNPGGFLDQAIRVASRFLGRGQLVLTQKGRAGVGDRPYKSDNLTPDTVPLVVLINSGSASASEIVAGALQDHDRALIVGQNSFGKGLVQGIFPLEYGAGLTLTTAKYYTPSGRLIQRDYSNGSLYDYYTRGGSRAGENPAAKPTGAESRTDTGRVVYSGGGITPDETIKPTEITPAQARTFTPVFAFTRDLVNGRIPNFPAYRVDKVVSYEHVVDGKDYPVTNEVFAAFKSFVAADPTWKLTPQQLDKNRSVLETRLRFYLITAAYGRTTADQVFVNTDAQVSRAIELLPRARELAMSAAQRRSAQP